MYREYRIALSQAEIDLLKKAVASRMEYLEDRDEEIVGEWEDLDIMLH